MGRFNVGGWGNPWNVGEDDGQQPMAFQQGPGGKGIQGLQRQFAGPINNGQFSLAPQGQFQAVPPPPQFDSPQTAAQWCAAYPSHPAAPGIMAQLAQIIANGVGMRMAVDGKFSDEMFYKSMPTKTRMEQLPLSPLSAIAAGGTGTMSVVVQKPFKGNKLSMFGDTGSFVISSITAAGQTVTAAGGLIPAGRYALVDSWPNIAFPALTSGATISITATNTTAVVANLQAVIDGETGEA